jgi:hypothetical protein
MPPTNVGDGGVQVDRAFDVLGSELGPNSMEVCDAALALAQDKRPTAHQ